MILQRLSLEEYKRLPLEQRMENLQRRTVALAQKLEETRWLVEELKKRGGDHVSRPAAAPMPPSTRGAFAGLMHKFFSRKKSK